MTDPESAEAPTDPCSVPTSTARTTRLQHCRPSPFKANIGRRIEHFATFKVDDNPYIRAFVSTTKGVSLDANDGQAVGVITAFCKTGSEAGMGLCPDFINNTLGSAVGPS